MRKIRVIISIMLIVFVGYSWFHLVTKTSSQRNAYKDNLSNAEKWTEQRLYDRAIECYEAAIEYEYSVDLENKLLNVYQLRSRDEMYGADAIVDYYNKVEEVFKKRKTDKKLGLELVKYYIKNENFKQASTTLESLIKNGIKDKEVYSLLKELKYEFELIEVNYIAYLPYSNNQYSVTNGERWALTDEEGDTQTEFIYDYVSQRGDANIYVSTENNKSVLKDSQGKIYGIFDFEVLESGMFSEGYIAVKKNDGMFYFYDSTGKQAISEGFIEAGCFQNGIAPVKEGGSWNFIDTNGKKVIKDKYERIILDEHGRYLVNNTIVVKKDGKCVLLDNEFKQKTNFKCEDVSTLTDSGIWAYKENNKWGYIDSEGNILIKPQYDEAKSFSNGFAGVRKETEWGFIDSSNNLVINYQFYSVGYFTPLNSVLVESRNENTASGHSLYRLKFKLEDK